MSSANDTICAIATPPGRGGVGVVRLSGPDSNNIARQLCGTLPPARQAGLRRFRNRRGEVADSALVLVFPAPASFTGDDVVALPGHGSPLALALFTPAS